MKRLSILLLLFSLLGVPALFAQDHGEIGVYADYTRLKNANNLNMYGVGGRIGFNVHPNVALEAEAGYNFEQSFSTPTISTNGVSGTTRSSLRLTNGLFGPKIQLTRNFPIRPFIVLKGGFLRFGTNNGPATFGNAGLTPSAFKNADVNGVFYPGGGIELFAGPIGIRADVGDEMYFDNGANHNLRFTIGPHIRF
jgi:hypothetical protein